MARKVTEHRELSQVNLDYVLLGVRSEIQSGQFFELSRSSQAILFTLSAYLESSADTSVRMERRALERMSGVRSGSSSAAIEELCSAGILAVTEQYPRRVEVEVLRHKKDMQSVLLETFYVSSMMWASLSSTAKSLVWLYKGHALHMRVYAPDMVDMHGYMIVPDRALENYSTSFLKARDMIKASKSAYHRAYRELVNGRVLKEFWRGSVCGLVMPLLTNYKIMRS